MISFFFNVRSQSFINNSATSITYYMFTIPDNASWTLEEEDKQARLIPSNNFSAVGFNPRFSCGKSLSISMQSVNSTD